MTTIFDHDKQHQSAAVTTSPITQTLSPGNTIAGISVDTFSFIFLGIGLTAPVVFLLIVFISMKCYSVRKFKRYKQYEARMRISREIWDLERRQYFREWKGTGSNNELGFEFPPDGYDEHFFIQNYKGGFPLPYAAHKSRKPLSVQGITYSNSNPDVFFKETPALLLDRSKGHVRAASSPGQINALQYTAHDSHVITVSANNSIQQINGDCSSAVSNSSSTSVHTSKHSVNSEEARALESFDKIYQDLDIDSSTLNTNSEYDPSSLIRTHDHDTSASTAYETIQKNRPPSYVHNKSLNSETVEVDLHHHTGQMESSHTADSTTYSQISKCDKAQLSNCFNEQHTQKPDKQGVKLSAMREVPVVRPVHLALVSDHINGLSSAVVSTFVTPSVASLSSDSRSPYADHSSNEMLQKSVFEDQNCPNSFSNLAYLSQYTPTEVVTKL